jgi:hypothetical protein
MLTDWSISNYSFFVFFQIPSLGMVTPWHMLKDVLLGSKEGWWFLRFDLLDRLTSLIHDFLDFLHLPGTIPRKVHASMIVQTETKFFIY